MVPRPFPHRKPSPEAREAMGASALVLGTKVECTPRHREIHEAMGAISRATGHRYVKLLASGDCAIMSLMAALEGPILVPDQGGWKGFRAYADIFDLRVETLRTELGAIDPEGLWEAIARARPEAFFITSFAGYMAEQPMKEIGKICREEGVLLVEDASGAIGDERLADGRYSDAIVCSTGPQEIINVVSGGFVSTDRKELLGSAPEVATACRISPVTCAGIVEELKSARKRVKKLVRYSDTLKEEVPGAIHMGRRGICVGLGLEDPRRFAETAKEGGLVTDLGYTFLTPCPRYERFLGSGVVVELKRLEVLEMGEGRVLEMAGILKECMD